MKCFWLLILLFVHSLVDASDDKVINVLKNVRNVGRITDQCDDALAQYFVNLNSTDDSWALKMLDATSKIPVGLLFSYNLGELGQFTQCLDTKSLDGLIKGKYCLGTISIGTTGLTNIRTNLTELRKINHLREAAKRITHIQTRAGNTEVSAAGATWAICLPDACSDQDIQEILQNLIGSPTALCQTEDDLSPPLTNGAIVTITILSYFAAMLVASTLCDLYFVHNKKEPSHEILVAFSVYKNGRKLFKTSKNSAELSCLNGIRFLSMLWVIIGHVFSTQSEAPLLNYKAIMDWVDSLDSMIIVSGTLSVDSFFLIGGALVVYGYMKAKHNGVNFNIFYFYLHRYLRLTPALAAAVLVSSHLLIYMGSGPKWSNVNSLQESCQTYWWSTLLYVQNYANTGGYCLAQTWYLSVDMQLYVLSPLILIPLSKYPKLGVTLVISLIVAFLIVPFVIAYVNELPGLMSNLNAGTSVSDFMTLYYVKTHARAAPYVMGAFLGYILAKIKFSEKNTIFPKVGKPLIIFLWTVCMAVMLTCIFGGHSTLRGEEYDKWGNVFYIALLRPAWALGLSWVIFACVTGYGGPINAILSLPLYQVLNRFTYSIYLLHYSILSMLAYASKTGIYFSRFTVAYSFWGVTMLSFGLSILWVLAFESPMIAIEKLIFKGINRIVSICSRKTKKTNELNA